MQAADAFTIYTQVIYFHPFYQVCIIVPVKNRKRKMAIDADIAQDNIADMAAVGGMQRQGLGWHFQYAIPGAI